MSPTTFAGRLSLLRKGGYPVLPLDDALQKLESGTLPADATVLTFDDGWRSFEEVAVPLLRECDMPATVYVTTHYVKKQRMVFNLGVQYLIWRSGRDQIDLAPLVSEPDTPTPTPDVVPAETACHRLMDYGEGLSSSEDRQALLERLGEALEIDPGPLAEAGMLMLMDPEQVCRVAADPLFDVQLHTHRHSMGDLGAEKLTREITDNRSALAELTDQPLNHFCYPSGRHSKALEPTLQELGITSATTCTPGFARAEMSALRMPRILDDETLSDIELEAELAGVLEIRRRFLRLFRRCRSAPDEQTGRQTGHIRT